MKAVQAAFIEIRTTKFTKKVRKLFIRFTFKVKASTSLFLQLLSC